MQDHSVDVLFWASTPAGAPSYSNKPYVRVGGSFEEALDTFRPHVVSTHRVDVAFSVRKVASARNIPLTIRGHSVDFEEVRYRGLSDIARIWLFPHFAELFRDQKNVEALPVAYDPKIAYPEEPDPRRYIVRTGFGNSNKDIGGFVEVARLCPTIPFELVVTGPYREYVASLRKIAPPNVQIHEGLANEEAVAIVRKAWACLRSHDLNAHPYGMPISIAEALGAGLPVIARAAVPDSPSRFGPEGFIRKAGFTYKTNAEAAERVQQIASWPRDRWDLARAESIACAHNYRTDTVLPRILNTWRALAQI